MYLLSSFIIDIFVVEYIIVTMKKNIYLNLVVIVFLMNFQLVVFGQEKVAVESKESLNFTEIANSIEKYKGKELTIVLRLKYYGKTFHRLVFYDDNNHDIEFDISEKRKDQMFKKQLKDLRRGMKYKVKFKVRGVGNLNYILANIVSFDSVVFDLLP